MKLTTDLSSPLSLPRLRQRKRLLDIRVGAIDRIIRIQLPRDCRLGRRPADAAEQRPRGRQQPVQSASQQAGKARPGATALAACGQHS